MRSRPLQSRPLQSRPLHFKHGFTLLELLIALTMTGVLSAIAFNAMTEYRITQAIREDQAQLSSLLSRGITISRRYSQSTIVTVKADGRTVFMRTIKTNRDPATGTTTFSDDLSTFSSSIVLQHVRLVSFNETPISKDTDVAFYQAPFGRLEMQNLDPPSGIPRLSFQTLNTSRSFDLDLVGVRGKPIFRSIQKL
jgi:prepilin-type N-terminal cleavage/methylation domain-containing protein